jgi:uncharacterized membrane protein
MSTTAVRQRYPSIDLLRGFAILLMFIFHFSYDLNYFGVVSIRFLEGWFWPNFRNLIVTLFLLTMGISLYLATGNGLCKKSYFRRLGLLILYATLVTVGSRMMFPQSYIWFGILHFIALASVLGLLFVRLGIFNLVFGATLVLLGGFYSNSLFDSPSLQWLGMMTYLPYTEDYVPLLPWFGVVLIGIYLGKTLYLNPSPLLQGRWHNPVVNSMCFAGRHSLHIYMLHQPIFIALLWLLLG